MNIFNHSDLFKKTRLLAVLFAVLMLPQGMWAQGAEIYYYDLYVNGTQVDNWNKDDVPVEGGGSVRYDPTSGTLYLDGVNFNGDITSGEGSLNIEFSGTNTIGDNSGFIRNTMAGDRTLTIKCDMEGSTLTIKNTTSNSVVEGFSSVILDGVYASDDSPFHFDSTNKYYADSSGDKKQSITYTTTPAYMLWIGSSTNGYRQATDTDLTSDNSGGVITSGTVSFDKYGNTLTLNNAAITGHIQWGASEDLTIALSGENSITNTAGDAINSLSVATAAPTLTLTKATSATSAKLTLVSGVGDSHPVRGFNIVTSLYDLGEQNPDDATRIRVFTSVFLGGGDGTQGSPYLITSAAHLQELSTYVNMGQLATSGKFFKLNQDIDCSSLTSFEPIGYRTHFDGQDFEGTFDGGGHTISKLSYNPAIVDQTTLDGIGLFCYLGGTVKNLTLSHCKFGGGYCNGAIAEFLNSGCVIDNCTITSCIIEGGRSGGLVGYVLGQGVTNTIIKNCSVINCTIQNGEAMGGIAGFTEDGVSIQNCTVDGGSITTTEADAEIGGIISGNGGSISNCTVKSLSIICGDGSAAAAITSYGGALADNYYYYDVTIKIGETTKSGYTQRGTGERDATSNVYSNNDIVANNGAVLYTNQLQTSAVTNGTIALWWPTAPTGNGYNEDGKFTPGQNASFVITPNAGYATTTVKVTYTEGGETKYINAIYDSTHSGNGNEVYYFTMPDAVVTATATLAKDLTSVKKDGNGNFVYTLEIPAFTYSGNAVVPGTISWTDGTTSGTFIKDTDYEITGYKKVGGTTNLNGAPSDAGDYIVLIYGKGNYTGARELPFTISKATVTLSFSPTTATVELGEALQAPTLTNAGNVSVTYSSSDTNVATINAQTGAVTTKTAGTTTITATYAGDSNHEGASAQYTLTVTDNSTKYDLWIGDIQVTEKNCSDILGDGNANQKVAGTFQYIPSLNKLFVTNTTANLKIETKMSNGLIIYLAPKTENKIGSIVYSGNGNAPLTITTDGNYPGTMILSAEAYVISGFSSLTMEQNLVVTKPEEIEYDSNNKRLETTSATIGVPLTPITEDKTIAPNGNELKPEGGSNDVNKVVDDILYTLGNANNETGDGYDDDGYIVINSITTDKQAVEVTQNNAPGTDEYLKGFKGLTFMVPAGSGTIEFDMQTEGEYAMKVMIGDATPVIVKQKDKGIVEIPYNVTEPTYVYAYNAGQIDGGSSARAIQKGKKTTVYIKIYTVGVNPKKVKSANPADQASGGNYQGNTSDLEGQEEETPAEKEARKGNVNGDETIDAADVAEMVNAIMGLHSGVYDKEAADVNGDGVVNAADIVMIVNKIFK